MTDRHVHHGASLLTSLWGVLKRVELLGIRKSAVGRRSDGSLEYEPGVPIRARFGSLAVGSLSKIERGPMEKIE